MMTLSIDGLFVSQNRWENAASLSPCHTQISPPMLLLASVHGAATGGWISAWLWTVVLVLDLF
jgi:hypothetical protein